MSSLHLLHCKVNSEKIIIAFFFVTNEIQVTTIRFSESAESGLQYDSPLRHQSVNKLTLKLENQSQHILSSAAFMNSKDWPLLIYSLNNVGFYVKHCVLKIS